MNEIIQKFKTDLDKAIDHFKNEIISLRTGRATPALVEDLMVEVYDQKMSLKQIASISINLPNIIVIQPWDKNAIPNIEKAISDSSLGLAPISEGNLVRLTLPQLTQERREQLIKLAKQKLEEARIGIRRHREDVLRQISQLEKEKKISEDEKFKRKDEIQKIVDEYNKKAEKIFKKKKEEIRPET